MTDANAAPDRRSRQPLADPAEGHGLQDAGPALRISERRHPGGAAYQAEFGHGPPVIEGPPDEIPQEVARSRERSMRRERFLPALGIAVLLLVAAVSFWSSGGLRGDSLLQALGALFLAFAVAAVLVGVVLARSD